MVGTVGVEETGTVTVVRRDPRRPRQVYFSSQAQCVALIVIEIEEACVRRSEIGEAAGNCALPFYGLVRIGEVNADATRKHGRPQGHLLAANANAIDGQG